MAITQLDTENADRDLTSQVTVLTDTPDASNAMLCQAYVEFGDGTKDLDGSGGNFELVITVGGQTIQPSPQVVNFGTEIRSAIWSTQFPVPANDEVVVLAKSPNAADTDVDVTAYLYDTTGVDITVADIIAGITDGDYDLQEMMRIIFAFAAGLSNGGGTTNIKFRDSADAIDRIDATVDANGNRTAITLNGN